MKRLAKVTRGLGTGHHILRRQLWSLKLAAAVLAGIPVEMDRVYAPPPTSQARGCGFLLVPLPFLSETSPEPGSWDAGAEGAGLDPLGCALWPFAVGLIAEALVAA